MNKLFLTIAFAFLSFSVFAAGEPTKFVNLKAYDGDTVKTPIIAIKGLPTLSVRLAGIDTPEIRGKCEYEKMLAQKAKKRINELLIGEVTITPLDWDKYGGRFVATIHDKDGRNIADVLIAEGLGRKYGGEKKTPWCK